MGKKCNDIKRLIELSTDEYLSPIGGMELDSLVEKLTEEYKDKVSEYEKTTNIKKENK